MSVDLILKHDRYFQANLCIALKSPEDYKTFRIHFLSTSLYSSMVPSGSILIALINPRGAQEGLAQDRKPQVQSVSRFIGICLEISIHGLNLHGFFIDLGGDFQIIFWSWMKNFLLVPSSRTSAGRLCGNQILSQSQRLIDFGSAVAVCLITSL